MLRRTTPAQPTNPPSAAASSEVSRSKHDLCPRGTADVYASEPTHRSLSKRTPAAAHLSLRPDSCSQIGVRTHLHPHKEGAAANYLERRLRLRFTSDHISYLFASLSSYRNQYLTQYLAAYVDPGIQQYGAHRRVRRFCVNRPIRMTAPSGPSCCRPQLTNRSVCGECDWRRKEGCGAIKYSVPHTACREWRNTSCRPAQRVLGDDARNTRPHHERGWPANGYNDPPTKSVTHVDARLGPSAARNVRHNRRYRSISRGGQGVAIDGVTSTAQCGLRNSCPNAVVCLSVRCSRHRGT